MKKFGFTLTEIIVALSILGIVAAVTTNLLGKVFPDQDKLKVLKVYNTINSINTQLLDDKGAYFPNPNNDCTGLGCTDEPTNPAQSKDANKTYNTTAKYISLLTDRLETVPNTLEIKDGGNNAVFNTPDGIAWDIFVSKYEQNNNNNNKWEIEHTLVIDLGNGNNTFFNSQNTTNIDRFVFKIDNNGKITGLDALTKAYLANPHKVNDKREDYIVANGGPIDLTLEHWENVVVEQPEPEQPVPVPEQPEPETEPNYGCGVGRHPYCSNVNCELRCNTVYNTDTGKTCPKCGAPLYATNYFDDNGLVEPELDLTIK